ncbi:MAG: hypothetical protein ABIQ74_02555 [Chitinophagales bacterium]
MKKVLISLLLITITTKVALSQDIIKGLPITISLVPKSAKQPNLKLKDGSGIFLVYKSEEGIHVIMGKNGKQYDFCDPIDNTKFVQVGEKDIENDGKPEVIVASKTSAQTIEVKVFKKADFETLYKEWTDFTGVSAVEFPGNGTVKMYDLEGNAGIYKFGEDGKISEAR